MTGVIVCQQEAEKYQNTFDDQFMFLGLEHFLKVVSFGIHISAVLGNITVYFLCSGGKEAGSF